MKDINLFRTKDSIFLKKVKSKAEVSKDKECDGFLISSSEKEARRIIESLKGSGKKIAIEGGDDAFNRRAIETLRINYLVSPEIKPKNNNLKQRDSGINHVVAKEAAKRNITIIISMSDIAKLTSVEKVRRLERLIQNVKICRKAKCDIKIVSLANNKNNIIDEKSRVSFGASLGMSSQQVSKAIKT